MDDTTKLTYEKPAMRVYHLQHHQQILQSSVPIDNTPTTDQW